MEMATRFGADVQQTAKNVGAQLAGSASRVRERVLGRGIGESLTAPEEPLPEGITRG